MNARQTLQIKHYSVLDTIGSTPMIEVEGIRAKLESKNPSGSVKDRMAAYMVRQAEKKGLLKKGSQIIEVTSGNTGVAFAMISAIRGYHFTAIMPESMSREKQNLLKSLGAQVITTPAELDMQGAVQKYLEIKASAPDAWYPSQFENPDNITAHEVGLGQEIINQMPDIEVFVAGIGTGGTILGVAKALRRHNPNIKIVGVEPAESAVLSGKKPGLHKIQGIGEGFIPKIVQHNIHLIDEVVQISSKQAKQTAQYLAKHHGLMVGFSSGANFAAAQQFKGNVVTLFPDSGEKYISAGIYR